MASWTAARAALVRSWWRSRPPAARDAGLAAALTAAAFVPALAGLSAQFSDLPRRPGDALAVVLVLAETVPLAVRTRWPAACLAVTGTAFAVHEALGYPPAFGTLGLYVALYSAGAWAPRLRTALAAAASVAYLGFALALHALGSAIPLVGYAEFYLALAAFWGAGAYVRRRRAQERERRAVAAAAATGAERARIAHELHDVVTHHVTAMVVQADAAQFLSAQPERTAASLSAISGTGRRALAELRDLLGVLDPAGPPGSTGRAPALGTLRELVEQTRLGGQPVEFAEDGTPPPLSAAAELAVYRVVQEALTNAVKHATGRPTVVRVGNGADVVDIDVTTVGGASSAGGTGVTGGGYGLTGLRERVGLVGGELVAAAEPGGGFRLHARIPARSQR